jgi:hypothetical protein
MAKYSMKKNGKEVGPAEVYAEPHTMSGEKVTVKGEQKQMTGAECMTKMNMSVGGISKGNYSPINPYGVGEMRGYGAATKGRKISGKMG